MALDSSPLVERERDDTMRNTYDTVNNIIALSYILLSYYILRLLLLLLGPQVSTVVAT